MANFFVIHSRADHAAAEAIAAEASALGFHTIDPFMPGRDFEAVLAEGIGRADVVVLLWSKASAQSQWVDHEIKQALKAWADDRLLVAALDDTPLPAGLRDQVSVRPQPSPGKFAAMVARQIEQSAARHQPMPAPVSAAPGASSIAAPRPSIAVVAFGLLLFAAILGGWLLAALDIQIAFPKLGIPSIDPGLAFTLLGIMALMLLALATVTVVRRWSRKRREHTARAPQPARLQPTATAPQIFVSYSRKDASLVDRLVSLMQAEGIGVWIDRSEQEMGGRRYAGPIVRAIRDSKAVAVMCSRHAFDSDHVVREVYVAGDFKKPFLNVHLDGEDFPDDLRYFLTGFPRISFQEFEQRRAREVIDPLIQHGRN